MLKQHYNDYFSVPSNANIEKANSYSLEEIKVEWKPPVVPNGPQEDLVYIIRWSTQTSKGLLEGEQEFNSSYQKIPYQMILTHLLPNHTYNVEVCISCCDITMETKIIIQSQIIKIVKLRFCSLLLQEDFFKFLNTDAKCF